MSVLEIAAVYGGGVLAWLGMVGFLIGFNDYKFSNGDVVWAFLWPLGLPLLVCILIGGALRP